MVKFAIYTFLGFIMESIYVSILERKIYFSGLLKGPFIPIYGFGALLILKTVPYYQNNFDTFFYSLICCTALEYLTHYQKIQISRSGTILKFLIIILVEFVCFIV